MVTVSTARVERLRGMLLLAQIERAEAVSAGHPTAAAQKDEVVAQLEDHLVELERDAEDTVAGQLLLNATAKTSAGRTHRRGQSPVLDDIYAQLLPDSGAGATPI